MIKNLIQKKGYTITVESWENDGDYSQTREVTVETLEKAKALANICELAHRTKNNRNGIGNTSEYDEEKCKDLILEFFENEENKVLLNDRCKTEDDYIDIFNDWAGDLLGYSEFYLYRVCDSYEISYTPEDVYVEKEIILTRGSKWLL